MGDAKEVTVEPEDQQNINTFNRLNQRIHEIDAELDAIKRRLEDYEDAENELMLADDEDVRYVLGECFVHMGTDDSQERLTTDTERIIRDKQGLEEEATQVKEKMAHLKHVLYTKFGDAINLEE